ncbi:CRISPR system Cascade subunit CasA [Rhodobacter aestuarii]|uniref:CRISPR system Cascade subunit CasA n=1 Tax=Rhodobacter aestuarii TaxID=453582 RepID=A0A1N7Q2W2_9RHOB|nr:type I-E CRISPR-associated protein Cse1/CasA [Rhodobacter aestuarii]PTV94065.1 CRISPR system Cascade subunit CasA [Rhodobacter aestuarii]SIT17188.1 CRISPR system Cascade subunit CasA [Rhodobacter aestuarii]
MTLNLIEDPWISVRCRDGSQKVIAPWQMTEPDVVAPDWSRPDFNIACLELLTGLVFLADPPADVTDWKRRTAPDPARLREKLATFAPAFNLLGDGPRFLQDFEPLTGAENPLDMLFIDSSGGNTAKNNADLMVHRNRYTVLDLPMAAMALYTFQAFAPAGGAGNRTSMRGGGPLVTLVDPREGLGSLWELIWANVPYGVPAQCADLPWMRPTRISDKGQQALPPEGGLFGPEAFFGQPRRLRLVAEGDRVTGVIQRPYGTNYALWKHPLSPYYRMKPGPEWLPKHPRAGRFGYRNWLGIVVEQKDNELSELALCWRDWNGRRGGGTMIVAGWAMDNMKPRDFIMSVQPVLDLPDEGWICLAGLIEAAEAAGVALRGALELVLAGGEAREAQREAFFAETETRFLAHLATIKAGGDPTAEWLGDLKRQAMGQFEKLAFEGIEARETDQMQKLFDAWKFLGLAFAGYGKQGKAIYEALGLPLPEKKKGKAA